MLAGGRGTPAPGQPPTADPAYRALPQHLRPGPPSGRRLLARADGEVRGVRRGASGPGEADVHHLSYERVGRELAEDLIAPRPGCHRRAHLGTAAPCLRRRHDRGAGRGAAPGRDTSLCSSACMQEGSGRRPPHRSGDDPRRQPAVPMRDPATASRRHRAGEHVVRPAREHVAQPLRQPVRQGVVHRQRRRARSTAARCGATSTPARRPVRPHRHPPPPAPTSSRARQRRPHSWSPRGAPPSRRRRPPRRSAPRSPTGRSRKAFTSAPHSTR